MAGYVGEYAPAPLSEFAVVPRTPEEYAEALGRFADQQLRLAMVRSVGTRALGRTIHEEHHETPVFFPISCKMPLGNYGLVAMSIVRAQIDSASVRVQSATWYEDHTSFQERDTRRNQYIPQAQLKLL